MNVLTNVDKLLDIDKEQHFCSSFQEGSQTLQVLTSRIVILPGGFSLDLFD